MNDLKSLSTDDFRKKYNEGKDGRDWRLEMAMSDVKNKELKKINVYYKPFDYRKTIYTGTTKGFSAYPRNEVSKHFVYNENIGFVCMRKLVNSQILSSILLTKTTIDLNFYGFQTYFYPLYLYPESNTQQNAFETIDRVPNLNMEIVNEIAKGLGLQFTPEKEDGNVCLANDKDVRSEFRTTFAPIDLLDYIYAVLHSPTYRETYKEFLKIDFPRVPYPHHVGAGRDVVGTGRDVVGTGRDLSVQEIQENFWKLVALGGELRQIHLLESPIVEKYITQYPEDGDNIVTKPTYKNGNVYINETQYFANVPEVAWNFYIGGYQPAQKWLKDRKDRELGFEDILHYQKIIVALTETDRIMKEIDKIEI